jgi:glycosyltransferase involved in cell wall biosynthesis
VDIDQFQRECRFMLSRYLSPRWHSQARRRRRRIKEGVVLSRHFAKRNVAFDPDAQVMILGDTVSINGLSRAYRYEAERWTAAKNAQCKPQSPPTALILGQPWDYPRLLPTAPDWFKDAYRIGLWVWELDQFPADWRFALDIVHEIWTPSTFSAKALRNGTDLPIKVVPHHVHVPTAAPLPRSRFNVRDDQFLGVSIMDLSTCPDRKNPLAHVRAWKQAFGRDDSAYLLMKVRFRKKTRFARNALMQEIGDSKNIGLVEEIFTDEDMVRFQKMADVYLSLHRAEGYGLNIHEMLAMGTPAVATGWSGNMDFMPQYANAHAVPYTLVPYRDRTYAYDGDNLVWAEADIAAAAQALRDVQTQWRIGRQRSDPQKTSALERGAH